MNEVKTESPSLVTSKNKTSPLIKSNSYNIRIPPEVAQPDFKQLKFIQVSKNTNSFREVADLTFNDEIDSNDSKTNSNSLNKTSSIANNLESKSSIIESKNSNPKLPNNTSNSIKINENNSSLKSTSSTSLNSHTQNT